MTGSLPATHPVVVLRTMGGAYVVTGRDWGKVCALRDKSQVARSARLEAHLRPVEVLRGLDFRRLTPILTPVALEDLTPGPHGYRFGRRGFGEWAQTSQVVAVYAGAFAPTHASGAEHVILTPDQAWHVEADGVQGHHMYADGVDGPDMPVDAAALTALPGAIVVRVARAKLPDFGPERFHAALPGWAAPAATLGDELQAVGVRVRGWLYDPVVSEHTEPLLTGLCAGADPLTDATVEGILQGFREACRDRCQRCGGPGAGQVAVPSPYLLHHFLLCRTCRACALTEARDAMTPTGGLTPLLSVGEQVTVWRSAEALHLFTRNGYARVASFTGGRREPRLPEPHLLDLLGEVLEVRALRVEPQAADWVRTVPDPERLFPGAMVRVDHGREVPEEFTVLDSFHGVAASTLAETGTYLVYRAGCRQVRDGVWLVDRGEAFRLLADGWDALPDRECDLGRLLAGDSGEVGVIRVDQYQSGASGVAGGRNAFDACAPAWTPHLDALLASLDAHESPPLLTRADVSPLTGEPRIRFARVAVEGRRANEGELRAAVHRFRATCLRSCMICGDPAHFRVFPHRSGRGEMRRCVCRRHEDEEVLGWSA